METYEGIYLLITISAESYLNYHQSSITISAENENNVFYNLGPWSVPNGLYSLTTGPYLIHLDEWLNLNYNIHEISSITLIAILYAKGKMSVWQLI